MVARVKIANWYDPVINSICELENWKYQSEFENSKINKSFLVAFFNGFTGPFGNAFYIRSMASTALLMITILVMT